jgi:hypothetical protein
MPLLGFLHLAIALFFMNHAYRTGRPQYWMFVLIALPLFGSIAYVMFEILPELGQSRRGRDVKKSIADVVAPDREFNRLHEEAKTRDTVETKKALAKECERKGMWEDARKLYEVAAQGLYADDASLLSGLARAELNCGDPEKALDTLKRLRAVHPDIKDQEAHLTYVRCMDDLGHVAEAETEYSALTRYYVGLEARTRYAQFLQKNGGEQKARALFEEVVRASNVQGVVLTDQDRIWLKTARDELRVK